MTKLLPIFVLTMCILGGFITQVSAKPPLAQPVQADTCRASLHMNLIGKTEKQLADVIFKSRQVRIVGYGEPVTMDYSATRLNVVLDKDRKVSKLTCG